MKQYAPTCVAPRDRASSYQKSLSKAVVASLAAVFAGGTLLAGVAQGTVAPRNGGALPAAMRERMATDPTAYQFQHAWLERARRAREAREAIARGAQRVAASTAVSGTVSVPVFAGYFSGEASPGAIGTWQTQLFGANPTGSVTDYWSEVSYGQLTMTGQVYGWTQAAQPESFYAGLNNGTDPTTDRVGEFIKELLNANDAAVDFGQYDNDGPDGVPNSGDDDGFVDMVAFIHSQIGGECSGNSHIWSHKWSYSAWNASGLAPYTTNDPAAGGGFIRVNDYTIQPAWNCSGNPSVIDIGVFCHEFGHALGLPDLYDFNFGGEGIGQWGIMGTGNWNTPASPAHPCAWTRIQLGWVTPTDADWTGATTGIPAINTTPVAYRLGFSNDRFRRSSTCAIAGSWSLFCGLTQGEATVLGWQSAGTGGGYGSSWNETVRRDYTVISAGGPVSLSFDYRADVEPTWDFAHVLVDVGGIETTLATYTGVASGTANIDLTPWVGALAQGDSFSVKFRVITNESFADDDGAYNSNCGAFAVDNIQLTGAGINDLSTFETYADGWYQDGAENPVEEYWLVENRSASGFDANLHEPGLLIWHVDDGVMRSAGQGTSAGESNRLVRGLVLEEADGGFDLNTAPTNRGEPSDAWPGPLGKTLFSSATLPAAVRNVGTPTQIMVSSIPLASPLMSVSLRAGDPAPALSGVAPAQFDNDLSAVVLSVSGSLIRHGATLRLVYSGLAAPGPETADIVPSATRWIDPTRIDATINPFGRAGGTWDLVLRASDGQTVTLPGAVTLNTVVPTKLVTASVRVNDGTVRAEYVLIDREPGEVIRLLRSEPAAPGLRILADNLRPGADGLYTWTDATVRPGGMYTYVLSAATGSGERELHRARVVIPASAMRLDQNVPNPFNPSTVIRFVLPERTRASLSVFNVAGRKIRVLESGVLESGVHDVPWDGRDAGGRAVASGVYYYRLDAAGRRLTRRMLLVK